MKSLNFSTMGKTTPPAISDFKKKNVLKYENSYCPHLLGEIVDKADTHIVTLRAKCPYCEFFWSAFSRIRTEYAVRT